MILIQKLKSFGLLLKTYIRFAYLFVTRSRRHIVGTFLVLIALVLALGAYFSLTTSKELLEELQIPTVSVTRISDLSGSGSSLPVIATVQAVSEASVRAESGGVITSVKASLGDKVSAGQILATLESKSQYASVVQAQGMLDAARAAYSRTAAGNRSEVKDITNASALQAQNSLATARTSANAAIASAYSTNADTLNKLDILYTDSTSLLPRIRFYIKDAALAQRIEQQRVLLGQMVKEDTSRGRLLSDTEVDKEIARAYDRTKVMRDYVDMVAEALTKTAVSDIEMVQVQGLVGSAAGARASQSGSLSALTGATQGLQGAQTATVIAQKQQSVDASVRTEDIASAAASLKQAQGAVMAASAQYEKTLIRTPISGTLNSFSLKRGDYVAQSSPVAQVANNGALELVTYITSQDRSRISVGQSVAIEGGAQGIVVTIAPAVDIATRKIEVRIGIPSNSKMLDNGTSVRVELGSVQSVATATSSLYIPLTALKVRGEKYAALIVSENDILKEVSVSIGSLSGSTVEILSGLTPEMELVLDARGHKAGDIVARAQ
jgi:multidrug efflux pump subunit AcrA (membrane-fusion protein)